MLDSSHTYVRLSPTFLPPPHSAIATPVRHIPAYGHSENSQISVVVIPNDVAQSRAISRNVDPAPPGNGLSRDQ